MLTRMENKVMDVLLSRSNNGSLLISPDDIKKSANEKNLTLRGVEKIVGDLSSDGYFDLVYSDRHGERVFCISFNDKGKAYKRNVKVMKRNLLLRLALTVGFAFISFLITLILRKIF